MFAPRHQYFTYNNSLTQAEYVLRIGVLHFNIVDQAGTAVLRARRSLAAINQRDVFYADEAEKQEVASVVCLGVGQGLALHIQDENRLTLGVLKPNWLIGNLLQEEWHIDDSDGRTMYQIREDNLLFSLFRRYLKTFPQTYVVTANGTEVCRLNRGWNPFLPSMTVSFSGAGMDKCLLLLATSVIATCHVSPGSI